jgi:hypothetical protein
VATVSTTNNVVLDGWVTVKSRRKASKQSCCNSKGKEVVVVELVFDVNTCVTHSPPVCAGEDWSTPLLELNHWWQILVLVKFGAPPLLDLNHWWQILVLERFRAPLLPGLIVWWLILAMMLWLEILNVFLF